jgi:hypothetical protein
VKTGTVLGGSFNVLGGSPTVLGGSSNVLGELRRVLASACIVLAATSNVLAQAAPIANAKIETRQLAQPLDREMAALAAQRGSRWVGYRVPMIGGPRRMCCFDAVAAGQCLLERGDGIAMSRTDGRDSPAARITIEPPSEMLVLIRLENAVIVRLRIFTPDCDIDAGGMPVVWLENVRTEDSVRWLTSLARTSDAGATSGSGVQQPAISALALHPGQTAVMTLIAFARDDVRPRMRSHALFWLAQRAGEEAVTAIAGAIDSDPEIDVKKRAVFALSQLPRTEGVPLLITVARTHRSPEVRRQAMFWLGQSRDPRAVEFFEQILRTK